MDTEHETSAAIKAYKAGDFDAALTAALELAKHNVQVGHYLCGIIYEIGSSSAGVDRSLSYKYYQLLAKGFGDDEGYLGCARILLQEKDFEKASLAVTFCRKAIDLKRNQFAYVVLGDIYQELFHPPEVKSSMKAYFNAAIHGAAWGWRRMASLESKQGNKMLSILLHILATFLFPLYLLLGG